MIHNKIKIYLEIPPKIGKKMGIHFYKNILSEINLPLLAVQSKMTLIEA